MWAIYKKELASNYHSMMGYFYTAFFQLIAGVFFLAFNLRGGMAEFGYVLGNTTVVLLVVIPVLTMRTLSEEKRQRTDQLLLTAPVKVSRIVLGKFLAVLTVFAVPLAVLMACPLILSQYGAVPLAQSYSCFLAFLCMGGACIAVGMFVSSLTESPIISAIVTFALLLVSYLMKGISSLIGTMALPSLIGFAVVILLVAGVLYLLSRNPWFAGAAAVLGEAALGALFLLDSTRFEGSFPKFLNGFALFQRYYDFVDGSMDLTHLVYYLSAAALLLFFTVQSVEKRRWN